MIPLNISFIYLKKIYDSTYTMRNILNNPIEEDIFSLEYVDFKVKKLPNGKDRDIEGYLDKIFKMGRSILIPHIQKLLNLVVKHDFRNPWM